MGATLRDNAPLRSRTPALVSAPADADSGPRPPGPAARDGRQRYVVGVFPLSSDAYGAVAELASGPCEVFVVSDIAPDLDAPAAGGQVTVHQVDASFALASNLAVMLSAAPTFAVLGACAGNAPGDARPPPGMERLFQNLVHHLATGATVIIVHAPGLEPQLRASRVLLDAKCAILLTHDVLQTAGCAGPNPAAVEDCCQTCATRACGRIPSPPIEPPR